MTSRWSVVAASVVGGAHVRAGVSAQDAFAVEQIDGVLLLAVADGAGSARLGAVGAPLAVSLAIQAMRRLAAPDSLRESAYWHRMLRVGPDQVLRRFRRAASAVARADRGLRTKDLGTTLTVVVAQPPRIGVFAVGDGIVVIRTASAGLELLVAPAGGADRPPGVTTLLTSRDAGTSARRMVAEVPDLTGVAVSSDGMDTLLVEYVDAQPVGPGAAQFDRLFARAEQAGGIDGMALTRLLTSPQVCALTDDDKTLVVAVPR
jgi:hypothetical protein